MARAQLLLQTFCQERFCILLLIRKLNGLTESKVKQNNARGGGVGWEGGGGGGQPVCAGRHAMVCPDADRGRVQG